MPVTDHGHSCYYCKNYIVPASNVGYRDTLARLPHAVLDYHKPCPYCAERMLDYVIGIIVRDESLPTDDDPVRHEAGYIRVTEERLDELILNAAKRAAAVQNRYFFVPYDVWMDIWNGYDVYR